MKNIPFNQLSFHTIDAVNYGLDCAVVLYYIRFWTATNKANKRNFKKGSYWCYNSSEALHRIFPFMSPQKISRILRKLESEQIIKSGVFNTKKYDKTKWYAIDYRNPCSNVNNGVFKSEQPIPVYTSIKDSDCNVKSFIKFKETYKEYFHEDYIGDVKEVQEYAKMLPDIDQIHVNDFFSNNPTLSKDFAVFVNWAWRSSNEIH